MSKLALLSGGMVASLATRRTRLAWAVTITRVDGAVFRICGGTRNKTIGGNLYTANPGFTLSSISCSQGANVVDTMELTALPSSAFEKLDFYTRRWFGARVEFNQFDWAVPADGFIPWPVYRVADVTPQDGAFVMQLRDLRMLWRRDWTLNTSKECQWRLGSIVGDFGCRVDLAPFTFPVEITSVGSARRIFTDSALAQVAGYFTEGLFIPDDGPHAGMPQLILDHATGGVITLAEPLLEDLVVSQTGTVIAGCLGRLEDCRDKFDNVRRMRAPGVHMSTIDRVASSE
jgi:uncharacterized phage protein (TIGR02218 family)